jgi:hypothetical protein
LIVFQCMSPTRSEYSKLRLKIVSLEDNRSRMPKKPSMVEEKKNDRENIYINIFLEQFLTQQRDEMMENFSHILQCLSIVAGVSSSSDHFGGTSPFKVQVNFDITIFEGQIDVDALDKWLNMLEGYFFVHNFSNRENITFALLKYLAHVKHWWETYWRKVPHRILQYMGLSPLGIFLWLQLRNNITMLETMRTTI